MSDAFSGDGLLGLWIFHHPFEVLSRALPQVESPTEPEEVDRLRARYRRLSRRGVLAVRVRSVVLVLFYFAAVVTVAGSVGGILGRIAFLEAVYRLAFAVSAGFSILLWFTAAALGRYIGVLENRLLVIGLRLRGPRGEAA